MAGPTYLENASPLLTPGHWSIDRVAHELYYMAEPGQDPSTETVVAPQLQTLVEATGTLAAPVHNITMEGHGSSPTWAGPLQTAPTASPRCRRTGC